MNYLVLGKYLMQKLMVFIAVFMLSGCAAVQSWIPSFWDDNQSDYVVQARLDIEQIDCGREQGPQVAQLYRDIRKFELYSESKGTLQKDVLRVIEPMKLTVKEWQARGEASRTYCELKKKILAQQAQRAAAVILGRW